MDGVNATWYVRAMMYKVRTGGKTCNMSLSSLRSSWVAACGV